MSCILRAWGKDFGIDEFMEHNELEVINTWYRGDPKLPTRPQGRKVESSGLSVELSAADFCELDKQVIEAIDFCKKNKTVLKKLASFEGVEGIVADFGVNIHPPGWASFCLPPELLMLLGELGISCEISVYPVDEEENET
jgi:hypothetical protein